MANREQLLKFLNKPREVQAVPVPGFGEVHVRMLNCGERAKLLAAVQSDPLPDAITQSLIMLSYALSDEGGNPLFDAGDVDGVGQFDAEIVERAVEDFSSLNKFRSSDVDEAEKK